jgi:chromosome segregation ATPase
VLSNLEDISVDRDTLKIHNQRQSNSKLFESEKNISFDNDSFRNLFQKKTDNNSNGSSLACSNFFPDNINARRNIPVFFKKNKKSDESLNESQQDETANKNYLDQLKTKNEEIQKLSERIQHEEKKNKSQEVKIQELTTQMNSFENILKKSGFKNDQLEVENQQIKKKNEYISNIKKVLGSFGNMLRQSLEEQTVIVDNGSNLSFLEHQNKAMIKRFFQHEKLLNIKQKKICDQKKELESVLKTNSQFDKQKLVYEESINMIRSRNKKSELELLELNQKNKKLESIIDDLTHKISDLELKLIRVSSKLKKKLKNATSSSNPQNSFSSSSLSDLDLNQIGPTQQINEFKQKTVYYKMKYEKMSKHYQTLKNKFSRYQKKYSLLLDKFEKQ